MKRPTTCCNRDTVRTPFVETLLAVVLLLALSSSAAAQSLGCSVNQTDGVSLKTGQSMIENTLSRVIKQGTMIELTVQVAGPGGKVNKVTSKVAAPSTLQRHDKVSGGDTPQNARSCTARILVVQPAQSVTEKTPPRLSTK